MFRFHCPRTARSTSILAILFAVLLGIAPAFAKEPPAISPVYPQDGDRDLILDLQAKLFDAGCYGNQLVRDGPDGEVDGQFRAKSRKAIWVFIDTFNDTVAGTRKFRARDLTPNAIQTAFSLDVVKNADRFCREFGEDFLNAYFTDANQHRTDGTVALGKSGACNRDEVSQSYLRGKGGEYARFTRAFERIRGEFETIFAGEINFKDKWKPDTIEAFDNHSLPVVDKNSARKALKTAFEQWQRLSFSYGLTKKDCLTCNKINDWIYLRNIGQSNGGHLVSTKSNRAGSTTNIFRFPVKIITLAMLENVVPLIKLHRGVTANFNLHYEWLLDPAKVPTGVDSSGIQTRTVELTKVREDTLHNIISRLIGSTPDQKATSAQNPLMRDLAKNYTCTGFDGSSVDQ